MNTLIKKFKENILVAVVLAAALVAVLPLLRPGFFPMHDDEQIARLVEFHRGFADGQFPVRWVGNLGFGYGYPLFNFYPPFVYWLGEVFYLAGFSLLASTKIVIFLGFFLSGLFMYLLAKDHFGKAAGLVGAVFYIFSPYHALDVYVRGALAESFSFVFLPAVFWATFRLFKEKNTQWVVLLSLFLSAYLLSHNLMIMVLAPAYGLYLAFLSWKFGYDRKTFRALFLSALLFLLLTAFFWLPALAEKKYTLVDQLLLTELADYRAHFVYLRQLWHSPWGFGGSLFGLEDGLSFEIGKLHVVLSFFAGIVGLVFAQRRPRAGRTLLFFLSLLGFSVLMMSFHSRFLWEVFEPLGFLQFPWRFLLLAAFAGSALAGGLTQIVFECLAKYGRLGWLVPAAVIVLVVIINAGRFRPVSWLAVDDRDYTGAEEIRWRVSRMSYDFVPGTVATRLSESGTTLVDIEKDGVAQEPYSVLGGNLSAEVLEDKFHRKSFRATGAGEFQLNTYYFPGWKAYINGNETNIYSGGKLSLITVSVPEGEHRLEFKFTNTSVRSAGNVFSLIGLVVMVVIVLLNADRSRKDGFRLSASDLFKTIRRQKHTL